MADRPETGVAPDRIAHAMPFGAEVRPDGTTRFRLWAPSAEAVTLVLGEGAQERAHPMDPLGEGWFEAVREAPAGCHYRFQLPDGFRVPDPASRHQAQDVHGPSTVIDPRAYRWRTADFPGRPWEETVLYELHVGTFTPEGTFAAIQDKLDHLEMLGITAVELMPVADFPGRRGWGYDGVLPFAPEAAYGTPDEMKALVDALHERGMTAFLDVVYNHFGPEGNYLHAYAKPFFGGGDTPWGPAIDYGQRPVRDFVLHNALYWLEEYRFDGLRLDAVQEIRDGSEPDLLDELAALVRERFPDRHVHLVLENDLNAAQRLERGKHGKVKRYAGQWNDDWHHAAQALLTGEDGGYYQDVHPDPAAMLVKAATDGFAYQGEPSPWRDGKPRGEPSAHLPPTAFVNYLQNHDQVGNRPRGDRLVTLAAPQALRALASLHLLSPAIPLLWMGEEWGSRTPFHFFAGFRGELAEAVRQGRAKDFQGFPNFLAHLDAMPDPNAEETFAASRLNWEDLSKEEHEDWLAHYELLLTLRRTALVPRLGGLTGNGATGTLRDGTAATLSWTLADGATLTALLVLGPDAAGGFDPPAGDLLFETPEGVGMRLQADGTLPGWSAAWFMTEGKLTRG